MGVHLLTELERLKTMITKLAHMVSHDLEDAIEALLKRDCDLARQVIANDDVIDRLEIDIEEECLKALALYQPVAVDLRYIVAVIKLNSDLERIGDLAVNIAEVSLILIDKDHGYQDPFDVRQMCAGVKQMVENVLKALIHSNTAQAYEVLTMDKSINEMHRRNYLLVEEAIKNNCDRDIGFYLYFISISRYLERIGDHTKNIAEDIIYTMEGKIVRHSRRNWA
ncbi:MAG: phosphate signaling complex protein PhoU [Deltaproteobacteria bacterium]|nr:phosphate signaling complex protein PhoU [Deltaproteobacteria bacterium]